MIGLGSKESRPMAVGLMAGKMVCQFQALEVGTAANWCLYDLPRSDSGRRRQTSVRSQQDQVRQQDKHSHPCDCGEPCTD